MKRRSDFFYNEKKALSAIFVFAVFAALPVIASALPEGESVVAGQASFDRATPDHLEVTTHTDRTIINYDSFSIAQKESVNFNQPQASSITLNRVVGSSPSQVFGSVTSNGSLFVINPNGILFGPNSRVDAPALVASTLDISNEDFLNGNYNFFKSGENAFLLNQGRMAIKNGGYVLLLAQAVENQGVIEAELGTVVLASGEKMTVALDDLNSISVVIDQPVKDIVLDEAGNKVESAVNNSGTISAIGGKVLLTAKSLNGIFDKAINNTGIIQATSLVDNNGVIELVAEGAPIVNSGTLSAGEVRISAGDSAYINIGKVIANGSQALPDGGKIAIEAATILQQGLISADSFEGGDAGEISVVSEVSTVLDEGSRTEAMALGIVGNGGRIVIDSKSGQTQVNRTAVVDVSAGAILGNAGSVTVGAYDQIGFYGVLNGHAPPTCGQATVNFVYHSDLIPEVRVSTDQEDYPPTGRPVISGTGFLPNQEVTINIFAPDGTQATLSTVADADGNFVLTYIPETLLWGGYVLTASDGARSAGTTFSDSIRLLVSRSAPTSASFDIASNGSFSVTFKVSNENNSGDSGRTDNYDYLLSYSGLTLVVAGSSLTSGSGSLSPGTFTTYTYNFTAPVGPSAGNITFSTNVTSVSPSTTFPSGGDKTSESASYTVNVLTPSDITAPTGSLIINSGAQYVNTTNVTLNLQATDDVGVTGYRVADGIDASGAVTVAVASTTSYSEDISWTLPVGDGTKTVAVQYRDAAGNWSSNYTDSIILDTTPPTIDVSRTPAPNANGWNNTDVTASYTASDGLSGLADPSAGSFDFISEGAGQSHTFTVFDNAGNSASATISDINIDKTAPTITAARAAGSEANANGWNNTDVTVTYTVTNAGISGVDSSASDYGDDTVTAEGLNHSVSGTVVDLAGNSATATLDGINIDKTAPTLAWGDLNPLANANGWNNTDVTIPYTTDDNLSGVDSSLPLSPLSFTSEGSGQTQDVTVTDLAGNSATFTSPVVNIDKTAPDITVYRVTIANSYGWNNTDVDVTYDATDSLSGIDASASDAKPYTLTLEGSGQSHTFTVYDLAGNSASDTVSNINIDKTAPVIAQGTPSGSAGENGWWTSDVTVPFSATDNLSGFGPGVGVLSADLASKTTSGEGDNLTVVSDTITDLAGNVATAVTAGPFKVDKSGPDMDALSVTPSMLWPPNGNSGKTVDVKLEGEATDGVSGVARTAMQLDDEYNKLDSALSDIDLSQAQFIALDPSRLGSDKDGRQYTIIVKAWDYAGNCSERSFMVVVPHDMRTATSNIYTSDLITWGPYLIYGNTPYLL